MRRVSGFTCVFSQTTKTGQNTQRHKPFLLARSAASGLDATGANMSSSSSPNSPLAADADGPPAGRLLRVLSGFGGTWSTCAATHKQKYQQYINIHTHTSLNCLSYSSTVSMGHLVITEWMRLTLIHSSCPQVLLQ